jgi:tetratricopeptide (TPR) repeat protein/tRNA A-37 threonylcarbamoyl transferase component Bud32
MTSDDQSLESTDAAHLESTSNAAPRALTTERKPRARAGRFTLLDQLGSGAMGVVHAAYDAMLDRRIAIKFIQPHRAMSVDDRERLLREARAMARVSHPNVVHVYDASHQDGDMFVAMEFVEGSTLRRWLDDRSDRDDWRATVAMFRGIAAGLAAAHAANVVHRDFKPDNVLIDAAGTPKVADFGLADLLAREDLESSDTLEPTDAIELTRTGATVGTPAYMAPEQHRGEIADASSDQFAFCVALWEALHGERPFLGANVASLAVAVVEGRRLPPKRDVPRRVQRIVERGLAVDPAQRWPDMNALAHALAQAERGRSRWVVGAAMLLGAVAIAVAWLAPRESPCTGSVELMAASWNEARQAEIEGALLATDLPYAADTWARASTQLDAWAQQWIDARTDACEATAVRREQSEAVMDLRIACLQRAERSFIAATRVLADADAKTVERADDVLQQLASIDACADVTALQGEETPPNADDQAAVEAARARLADATAERAAGRPDDAQASLDAAWDEVDGVGYAPVRTELLLRAAALQSDRGEHLEAEASARHALQLAVRSGQRELARSAALFVMRVAAFDNVRPQDALGLADIAAGLSNDEPSQQADLAAALAAVHETAGDLARAVDRYRRAAELFEQARGFQSLAAINQRLNLARVLTDAGRVSEAEALHDAAIPLLERELGATHPVAIDARMNRAKLWVQLGRNREAEADLRALLELSRDPLVSSGIRSSLAVALQRQGKLREGATIQREAIAAVEVALGPEHPRLAFLHGNLATMLMELREHDEAIEEAKTASRILGKALPPGHPDVIGMRNNYASVLHAVGRYEEALAEHRVCARERQAALGPDHPDTATSHYNIAVVSSALERSADAEAEARTALRSFRAAYGADHRMVFASQTLLGQSLLDQGHVPEAIEELEAALAGQERIGGTPRKIAQAAELLAEALWTKGDREAARTTARRALEQYTLAGEGSEDGRRQVEAWLASH